MLDVLRKLNIKEKLCISLLFIAVVFIPGLKISSEYNAVLNNHISSEIADAQEDLYVAHQYILFESWDLRYQLLSLSEQSALLNYIQLPSKENKERLEGAWQSFFFDNLLAKRLTYIDLKGMEKVRVDFDAHDGSILIPTQYQDKSKYPFFIRASKNKANDVFEQSQDLLVDHGQFIKPYELAFRVIKPIVVNKERIGYLVMHTDMNEFERGVQENINSDHQMRKVNAHGFYVLGQSPEKLYGGSLIEHNDANIRKDFPELWQAMLKKKEGVWQDKGTVYIFRKHKEMFGEHEPFYVMYYKVNKGKLAREAFQQIKSELMLMIGIWVLAVILAVVVVSFYLVQKKKARSKLYALAYHDPLTRLYNRIRMTQEIEKYIELEHSVSLIYIDLHELRQINESYSYQVGDMILREIGERLLTFGNSLAVGRVADNSFAMLVDSNNKKQLEVCIAKLQAHLYEPINISGKFSLRITTTLGVARLPHDAQTPTELLLNANTAANKLCNKHSGGFEFYQQELSQTAIRYMTMRHYIEEALKNGYFYLVYQPKVHSETKMLVGVEALVRMKHPVEGDIFPDQFIPVAEQSGFIYDIDLWVLKEACRQGREWLDDGKIFGSISVNTTTEELADTEYFSKIRHILNETKIPANYVKIEITERMVMSDDGTILDNLHKLSRLGVALSIDDFGTGYSSFNYINNLPVRELKIDRTFVQNLEANSRGEQVIQAIIAMSKALDMDFVAEGVETKEQMQLLKNIGCYVVQGYYYSRPVLPQGLDIWFER